MKTQKTPKNPENLEELIAYVDFMFDCNPNVYHKLKDLPKEKWQMEIFAHSVKHLSKSVGRLKDVLETYDHTQDPLNAELFEPELLKKTVVSAVATLCKLMALLGLSEKEVIERVVALMQSVPQSKP